MTVVDFDSSAYLKLLLHDELDRDVAEVLGDAVMATWDRRLGAAAQAIGLGLVPAA